MRLKNLCFGLIGFCLFGAVGALARPIDMIPAPPGAGMSGALGRDGGASNADRGPRNPYNDRLNTYRKDFAAASKNYDDADKALYERDQELKKTDDANNAAHTPGNTKVGGADQADKTYNDILKTRNSAWDKMMDTNTKIDSELKSINERSK